MKHGSNVFNLLGVQWAHCLTRPVEELARVTTMIQVSSSHITMCRISMHQDNANSEVTMALLSYDFARHLFRLPKTTKKKEGDKDRHKYATSTNHGFRYWRRHMSLALNENVNSNREVFEFVVVIHDYSSTDHRRAITTCLIKSELLHAQLCQLDAP